VRLGALELCAWGFHPVLALLMSQHTREEILKLIEENGGPEGLDLSGKDLSGIDLNERAIGTELE